MTPPIRMVSVPEDVATEAVNCMARAYERVHSLPRVSDTELANRIGAAKEALRIALRAAPVRAEGGALKLGESDLFEVADIIRTARGVKHVGSKDYAVADEIVCFVNNHPRNSAAALATREAEAGEQWVWRIPGRSWVLCGREDDVVREVRVDGVWVETEVVALSSLRAQPQARAWGWDYEICTGCSASLSLADIKAGGHVSCCPERRMVTVQALVDAYEAQRKPKAREEAQPVACGGCGAKKPSDRCLGCFHDFYPTPPAPEAEKLRVALREIAATAGKYGPDGTSNEPHARAIHIALAALQQERR